MPSRPDDPIACERAVGHRPSLGHADTAGEHERIRGETRVVQDRAGDGRQADLVAVVGDAVDHAVTDSQRVQRAVWHAGQRRVGWAETQDVGDGDRLVGDPEDVADDPADSGVGAAERFDRRRVIVRFGLESDRRIAPESDDARVADECRLHERCIDRVGAVAQHLDERGTILAVVGRDRRSERLVGAVFAPRLGERFELDVGGLAPEIGVVRLDDAEFLWVESESSFDTDGEQLVHRLVDDLDRVGDTGGDAFGVEGRFDRADLPAFDDRIGDDPADDPLRQLVVDVAEFDAATGRGARHRQPQLIGRVQQARRRGIGHAGQERHLGAVPVRFTPTALLEQRIDQETVELVEGVLVEVALEEDQVGDLHLPGLVGRQTQLAGSRLDGCRPRVGVDGTDRQAVPGDHWSEPTRSDHTSFAFGRKFRRE